MPTSDHQAWRAEAKCGPLDPMEASKLFFVERGGKAAKAKVFCSTCPVQRQCLNYAIFYNEGGIWGGMSESERNAIAPLIGILSESVLESQGVSTDETRDYRQWGLAEAQIQESRRKHQAPQPEPSFQVLNQQPPILVVEL